MKRRAQLQEGVGRRSDCEPQKFCSPRYKLGFRWFRQGKWFGRSRYSQAGAPGWLSQLSSQLLILAQALISGSWDQAVLSGESASGFSLSLSLFPHLLPFLLPRLALTHSLK